MILNHPAYIYVRNVTDKKIEAPTYVRKQCAEFRRLAEGGDDKYYVDETKVDLVDGITQLMIMPKGLSAGKTVREAFVGFDWLLLVAALCVVHRDNPQKRRYQTVILEIARKNGKTFVIAVFFIFLLLTEPRFSKMYSVAPDGKLSREVQDAIREIIRSSPVLGELTPQKFRLMRDKIICKLTDSEYTPLNYSNDKLDGKLPSVFLVDEVGALPSVYAVEAMRSGQLTVLNKLGCIISTKYPREDNPFEDEVRYAKRVLDGLEDDDTVFALLYEPDNTKDWMADDKVLMHANPLALEIPEIWDDLLKKRQRAIAVESARENFLCKHCNIIYQGLGTESFVAIEDVKRGRVDSIDWRGRSVWLGLDLAMTDDNCAYAMVAEDDKDGVLCHAGGFIPADRIAEKSQVERLDYAALIRNGCCYACGDRIVDYGFIEQIIMSVEDVYGVTVRGFGFDRYNCLSTAQKLEAHGWAGTIVDQHSRVLHAPTKWLAELIAKGKFHYMRNRLLEINFQNCRCTYDTNMNRYVNKKKSNGKIDLVAATINALYLMQQHKLNRLTWVVQD